MPAGESGLKSQVHKLALVYLSLPVCKVEIKWFDQECPTGPLQTLEMVNELLY